MNTKKIKVLLSLLGLVLIMILSIGCTKTEQPSNPAADTQKDVIELMKQKPDILNIDVKEEPKVVNIFISVGPSISDDQAVSLIADYTSLLKEKYRGKQISVQMIQDGSVIGGMSLSE